VKGATFQSKEVYDLNATQTGLEPAYSTYSINASFVGWRDIGPFYLFRRSHLILTDLNRT